MQMLLKIAVSKFVIEYHSVSPFVVVPYKTVIEAEDVDDNGTSVFVRQEFVFDREEGALTVHVDQHSTYEKSTLKFNDSAVKLTYMCLAYQIITDLDCLETKWK